MYVKERKNKDGSTSYTFKCSTKTANGFQQHTKTVRLPSRITGKKAIKEWLTKEKIAWKDELENGVKLTTPQKDILFIDFARQYNEELLLRNPTGYAHYNANASHIKTIEPKLGKYKLSDITPAILTNFFNYLMARRYDKTIIIAKPALSMLIDEKHLVLRTIAEGCKIAQTTLFSALHGEHISKETATKICDYLQIPLREYFSVSKESRPYSYSANNGVKVFIHGVLQEAVMQEIIERNSANYVRPITGTKGTKMILESLDEYKHFIECLNTETDLRKKAAFALYIYLGLRNAEVCGLSWKNIDLANGTIAIVQNTIYAGKKFGTVNKPPKSKQSNRVLSMPTALTEVLSEYKTEWESDKEILKAYWGDKDKLFLSSTGKETSGGTLAGWLSDFEKKHGIKHITPHGLRHSAVTVLITNGVDIKTVSARAGHADIQTTLNIYSHYTKEADRQAADRIDELFDT